MAIEKKGLAFVDLQYCEDLSREDCEKYYNILREELIPALGCTEPICLAFAAAEARQVLGETPERVIIKCSGNIIKNVKGAIVPNSGNLKGIEAAVCLGIAGGNPDKKLEVLEDITEKQQEYAKKLLSNPDYCQVKLLDTPATLHVILEAYSHKHTSMVEIIHTHANIVTIMRDQKYLLKKDFDPKEAVKDLTDRSCLSIRKIVSFADHAGLHPIQSLLEEQIAYNSKISKEGLEHPYGVQVGACLLKYYGSDVKIRAQAAAAAGSDARMSGCTLPVIINSGSGNQGITVSIPVIEFAKEWNVGQEKLLRALIVSNLVAIHEKTGIGRLSAYCGAVSAACGSGAALTYMRGGTYQQICDTITNTLGNISGMVCDGAKPSCAAKIMSAVDAAIMGHYLAMDGLVFQKGDGIIKGDVEQTIDNIGKVGRLGMQETDRVILKLMIGDGKEKGESA